MRVQKGDVAVEGGRGEGREVRTRTGGALLEGSRWEQTHKALGGLVI